MTKDSELDSMQEHSFEHCFKKFMEKKTTSFNVLKSPHCTHVFECLTPDCPEIVLQEVQDQLDSCSLYQNVEPQCTHDVFESLTQTHETWHAACRVAELRVICFQNHLVQLECSHTRAACSHSRRVSPVPQTKIIARDLDFMLDVKKQYFEF